jgi:energy-coupling factor transport system permease protein
MNQTSFGKLHPLVTFLYFIGVLILTMIIENPIYLLIGFLVMIMNTYIHTKLSKKLLIGYLLLFLSMILLNVLFVREGTHVLFTIQGMLFTVEGFVFGVKTGMMILILLLTFQIFNEVITTNKILYLFSRFSHKATILLALSLRFVPLFKKRIQIIYEIQLTKEAVPSSLKGKLHNGMAILQTLLNVSIEEALQTADSMRARGYSSNLIKRTSYQHFRFTMVDYLVIVCMILFMLTGILGVIYGYGSFAFFPEVQQQWVGSVDIIFCVIDMIFIGLPFLLEGGSRFRWHLLNLKI